MRTSPLHGEFDQLHWASSEGCGLHLRMRAILTGTQLYYSMLLVVVFSHIYYPMIVTSNIFVIIIWIIIMYNTITHLYTGV